MPKNIDNHELNNENNDTIDTSMQMSIMKAIAAVSDDNKPQRAVTRPNISPRKGLLKIFISVLVFVILFFVLKAFSISVLWILPAILVLILFTAKKTVIWLVLLYQKYAPESIRASCLFTPTCSDYMILAILKYGLIKGVFKGIKRLLRCHYPNGGIDYP